MEKLSEDEKTAFAAHLMGDLRHSLKRYFGASCAGLALLYTLIQVGEMAFGVGNKWLILNGLPPIVASQAHQIADVKSAVTRVGDRQAVELKTLARIDKRTK